MEGREFELRVQDIARLLWPSASVGGSTVQLGKERDGVYVTEDSVHLVEATCSRRKDKAQDDARKLDELAQAMRRSHRRLAVRCWLVTLDEPTADQRDVVRAVSEDIACISFSQFQSRLIDARGYLRDRDNYQFGSISHPDPGAAGDVVYVPLDLVEIPGGHLWSPKDIAAAILEGRRFTLLGDYGAGKSMTLREVYRELVRRNRSGETARFPIYLNLRDHHGQADPTEVLYRHATRIGFSPESHLVRAWRAGYAIPIIDGFDELTSLGWTAEWKHLRQLRWRSMEVVRRFVAETPKGAGLALAGRAHFFDGREERTEALGTRGVAELTLSDFTDEQMDRFLTRSDKSGELPLWLPRRPLLLGYLAARKLTDDLVLATAENVRSDPASGWDYLVQRIAERETRIDSGISPGVMQKIFERLATKARCSYDGTGPLRFDDLIASFKEVLGYPPDEAGVLILQRLPGLGIADGQEGTRCFVDRDLADVCRAGDVVRYMQSPFTEDVQPFAEIECGLGQLGVEVAAMRLRSTVTSRQMSAVVEHIARVGAAPTLLADVIRIAAELGVPVTDTVYVRGCIVPSLELDVSAPSLRGVHFQECFFSRLELDPEVQIAFLPEFRSCYFAEVDGPVGMAGLASSSFVDCVIDRFAQTTATTDGILDLDLSPGVRVGLTVVRKLFLRPGSGRKEKALYSGLEQRLRSLVPDVLHVLQQEGLAVKNARSTQEPVWMPTRSNLARVARILEAPQTSLDPCVQKWRDLA